MISTRTKYDFFNWHIKQGNLTNDIDGWMAIWTFFFQIRIWTPNWQLDELRPFGLKRGAYIILNSLYLAAKVKGDERGTAIKQWD